MPSACGFRDVSSSSTGSSTELHAQFHWGFCIWDASLNHWPQDWTQSPAPPSPQRSGVVVPVTSSHPEAAWRPRASPQNRTQTLVTQETPWGLKLCVRTQDKDWSQPGGPTPYRVSSLHSTLQKAHTPNTRM